MDDWLVAHQASVQFYALLTAFAVVAAWESFRPRRSVSTPTAARWFNNLALAGIGGVGARLVFPVIGVAFAVVADQRGWGWFNVVPAPTWLAFAVAVLAIDCARYLIHRLSHAVPILWRMHKVHHSELDVDCATAVRHHPLEYLFVGGADLVVIGSLGAPPLAVLAVAVLTTVVSIFNHGNVVVASNAERLLRRFVVTPDMHRIHHSIRDAECNANFAMLFSWWDRIFRTWCDSPRLGHEHMPLGIAEARSAADVTLFKLLVLPFRRETAATPGPAGESRA